MESISCKICGKVIEGYTKKQVEYLLKQHMLTHNGILQQKKNVQNIVKEMKGEENE